MTKEQFLAEVEDCAAREDAPRLRRLAEAYLETMLPQLSEDESWRLDALMRGTYQLADAPSRARNEAA